MVYVQSKDGQPLMPTTDHRIVRLLLNAGKARVVRRTPFTIRLNVILCERRGAPPMTKVTGGPRLIIRMNETQKDMLSEESIRELETIKDKSRRMLLANPELSAEQISALKSLPLDLQRLKFLVNKDLSPKYMKALGKASRNLAPFEVKKLAKKNYTESTLVLFDKLKNSCKLDRALLILDADYSPEATEILFRGALRLNMHKLRIITKKEEDEAVFEVSAILKAENYPHRA